MKKSKWKFICRFIKCVWRNSWYLFIIWFYVPSEELVEWEHIMIKKWFINEYYFNIPKLDMKIRPPK